MATEDTYIYSPPSIADELTQMKRGEVRLHVPVEDNVIQVGSDAIPNSGEIIVRKRRKSVTVRNVDGSPLQAEILGKVTLDEASGNLTDQKRTPILKVPVAEINFKRGKDLFGTKYWCTVGEGVNVTDKAAVTRFARVVGMFAITKQGGKITTRL